MKKGTFMNEKEWLDYFETINNRKPTEEEIQQAKANGEYTVNCNFGCFGMFHGIGDKA